MRWVERTVKFLLLALKATGLKWTLDMVLDRKCESHLWGVLLNLPTL